MMYQKEQTVYTSRSGANTFLSLIGAVEIIQDSICEYFKSLDIDEIKLKTKYNCIWVFTRNSVEFLDRLTWEDSFRVECYISSKSPVKLVVSSAIYKKDGTLSLISETDICLVDLATLKIKKIDDDFVSGSEIMDSKFDIKFDRPVDTSNMTHVASTIVQSTSIDYCGHVNNVEYIRFILNTYTAKQLKKNIKKFDIIYISQSLEGDMLDIYKDETDCGTIFEIKVKDKAVTRCKIVFD